MSKRKDLQRRIAESEDRLEAAKEALRRKRAEFDQVHAALHTARAEHNALLARATAEHIPDEAQP